MPALSKRQVEAWEDFLDPAVKFLLMDGSIRSGKTFSSLLCWLHWIPDAPPGHIAIIGKTRETIGRNVLDVIRMIRPAAISKYSQKSATATIMGREVQLIGANDAQAETKIRGLTLAGSYIDEVTLLPEPFFVQLLGRHSVDGAKILGTTNPDSPGHWLKIGYLDCVPRPGNTLAAIEARGAKPLTDWRIQHFTMDDNPSLSEKYKDAVKREFTGLWYRRFIQGEWVSAEGAVYDMWEPAAHVVAWDDLPRMTDVYAVGMDYGTQNPTAALILAHGEDGTLYFVDEFRIDSTNRGLGTWTDAQQSEAVLAWLNRAGHAPDLDYKPQRLIVDPAAASFKTQLRLDGAWGLTDANNDVAYGIRLMANGLSSGWLKISDRCAGLINEFPGYSWDSKAQLQGYDKPIKVNDHSLDAARYALATTERLWRRRIDQTLRK